MSLRAIIWAFDQIAVGRSPSTSASLVLLKIADRANDDGVCWPGRRRLGRDIDLSDETVRQCVRKLEPVGLVVVERRQDAAGRDLSNIYRLPMGEGQDFTTPPVKSGGGCLEFGPKSIKRTITTSSNKRGGANAPRSLSGWGARKKESPGSRQDEVDQETGIHHQGNEDDLRLLAEIKRYSTLQIAAAVEKAAMLDRKGRAWPSAVWKTLRLQAMSVGNGGSGPPAWATLQDGEPSAVAAAEGCYETDFEIVEE